MRSSFYILILLSAFCIILSCSKGGSTLQEDPIHEITLQDTIFPVIEINKPLNNQVFVSGESILVEGKVTDISLYRGKIRIVDDANNSVIKEQLYEIHGFASYDFNLTLKTSVLSAATYTVSVEFEDHGLNVTTRTVKVKVNL